MKYVPVWRQAEPYRHTFRDHLRDVREILAPFAVLMLLIAAGWLTMAVAAAWQAPVPR